MDNSDSPSIVEQLQQDVILIVIPLLIIAPSSMMCFMLYACQLASCSMGISNYASCPDSMTLFSPCPCFLLLFSGVLQSLLFRVFPC